MFYRLSLVLKPLQYDSSPQDGSTDVAKDVDKLKELELGEPPRV